MVAAIDRLHLTHAPKFRIEFVNVEMGDSVFLLLQPCLECIYKDKSQSKMVREYTPQVKPEKRITHALQMVKLKKKMNKSLCYRENHEEVTMMLKEIDNWLLTRVINRRKQRGNK